MEQTNEIELYYYYFLYFPLLYISKILFENQPTWLIILFSTLAESRERQCYHTRPSRTVRSYTSVEAQFCFLQIFQITLVFHISQNMTMFRYMYPEHKINPFQMVWINNLDPCSAPRVLLLTHKLPQHELGKFIHLILSLQLLKVSPTVWQNNNLESNDFFFSKKKSWISPLLISLPLLLATCRTELKQ